MIKDEDNFDKFLNPLTINYDILSNKDLSMGEKILLTLINNVGSYRIASKLMEKCCYTRQAVYSCRKSLIEKGYIKKELNTPEEIKNIVIDINTNDKLPKYKCEWCGKYTHVLQKHHFPIKRSDGGVETVNICPDCHYLFHSIENI